MDLEEEAFKRVLRKYHLIYKNPPPKQTGGQIFPRKLEVELRSAGVFMVSTSLFLTCVRIICTILTDVSVFAKIFDV
jgi:hypothetical protein